MLRIRYSAQASSMKHIAKKSTKAHTAYKWREVDSEQYVRNLQRKLQDLKIQNDLDDRCSTIEDALVETAKLCSITGLQASEEEQFQSTSTGMKIKEIDKSTSLIAQFSARREEGIK